MGANPSPKRGCSITTMLLTYIFFPFLQFVGSYGVLSDLNEMNKKPTTVMYNVILAGYFRKVSDTLEISSRQLL